MCGIVGVITKHKNGFTSKQVDIFNTLLYIDALRGEDSTGAFCVDNLGNVEIIKEAHTSGHTLGETEYMAFTTRAIRKGWALIGHNRKATKGSITDENAHPFWVEDKLVLVHNGTMYGDHKQHANVDVDSHAIAHLIVDKPTLEEALGEFHAAYALVWYNVQQKALHFLRNSQRPLCYMETDNEIIYASEAEMIDFVRRRENLPIKQINLLKEMTLVTNTLQEDKSYKEEVRAVVPKVRAGVSAGNFSSTYLGWEWEGERMYTPQGRSTRWAGYDEDGIDWATGDVIPIGSVANSSVDQDDDEHCEVVVDLGPPKTKHEVGNVPTYPWSKFHTMEEFEELKHGYANAHISVECMDYLSMDDDGNTVFMIGKTNDSNEICVVFPVNKALADHISNPERKGKAAMFNVCVDVMRWTKKNSPLGMISFTGKDALLSRHGQTIQ